MSSILKAPFTCIISGPTGCGKTQLTLRLIRHAQEMIQPAPDTIVWCYGIYQSAFDSVQGVRFQEGLPNVDSDFNKDEHTLLILDDLMHETNNSIMTIFTRGSHHRNISVIYLTQNLYYGTKQNRTMNLNTHYMVLFKNPRDGTQIQCLSRQMYPHNAKYLEESFRDATKEPYNYLFIDLKADTDENMRLKTRIFPDDHPTHYVYVPKNK